MEHLDAILNAILGSAIASWFAKAYISKSLKNLDELSEKVTKISMEISAIVVKLGISEKNNDMVLVHDRKIAAMENELYGHGITRKASSVS